jgi:hypothetical protein
VSSTRFRFILRSCVCALALIAAVALVACGDSADSSEDPREFSVTTMKEGSLTKAGPESVEAGVAEFTFTNYSDVDATQQMIRVEGEHSSEEVLEGLGRAVSGLGFPDWLFPAGGIGVLGAGERAMATQVLRPGSYYAFDIDSAGKAKPLFIVEVTGEESDEEIEGSDTIEATEYAFSADPLSSGVTEVVFRNAGAQPHQVTIAPLKDNATAKDVEDYYKTEDDIAPFYPTAVKSTGALEAGESQLVTLGLAPGRYVILCYLTDREGSPGHHFKGMIDEVEVK